MEKLWAEETVPRESQAIIYHHDPALSGRVAFQRDRGPEDPDLAGGIRSRRPPSSDPGSARRVAATWAGLSWKGCAGGTQDSSRNSRIAALFESRVVIDPCQERRSNVAELVQLVASRAQHVAIDPSPVYARRLRGARTIQLHQILMIHRRTRRGRHRSLLGAALQLSRDSELNRPRAWTWSRMLPNHL